MNDPSNRSHNVYHGILERTSSEPSPADFCTWICCMCSSESGGMSTTMNPKCPECQHIRCNFCPVEEHYYRKDKELTNNNPSRREHNVTTLYDSAPVEPQCTSHIPTSTRLGVLADPTSQPHQCRQPPITINTSRVFEKSTVKREHSSGSAAFFACPFHKKDPDQYNQFTEADPTTMCDYFQCTKKGWRKLKDLVK